MFCIIILALSKRLSIFKKENDETKKLQRKSSYDDLKTKPSYTIQQ